VTGQYRRQLLSWTGLLALLCCCGFVPAMASADVLLPTAHGVFTGLTGGSYSTFEHEVGKHPAVDGVFVTWVSRLKKRSVRRTRITRG
jgi:hypothetical protein